MGEEAAAVLICCMPSTSSLMKSVQEPLRSWLSNARQRALRLTGSSRTGVVRSGGGSQSNFKGSLERNRNAVYTHPAPKDRHTAWAGANIDTYPLRHLNTSTGGVWKQTDIQIYRGQPEDLEHGSKMSKNVAADKVNVREQKTQQTETDEFDLDSLYIVNSH